MDQRLGIGFVENVISKHCNVVAIIIVVKALDIPSICMSRMLLSDQCVYRMKW